MRMIGVLFTTLGVVGLNPTFAYGQVGEQHPAEEQAEPYHKHHDTRHGHDHFYPDRGAIVRDLPKGTIGLSYAGVSYRYHDGIWLEAHGPAYMVVAPPIGLVAPTLPLYSTIVTQGGETFLYANDTYYRPRPDLGGYEVANDPTAEPARAAPEALVGGQLPATPVPTQAAPVQTPPVPSPVIAGGLPATVPPGSMATPVSSGSTAGPSASGALAATASPAAAPVALTVGSPPGAQKGPKVFLYPKNGQSSDQQAHDRYDCYRFAVAQSGFDPMHAGGTSPTPVGEMQSDYERAQSACFEARGYANR
jgi:hypothetical protein